MKHLVVIDDETFDGAALLKKIKEMPNTSVEFIEDKETIEDCIPVEDWANKLRNDLKLTYTEK